MESGEPIWYGKLNPCCCCGEWKATRPPRSTMKPLSPRLDAWSVLPFRARIHAVDEPAG